MKRVNLILLIILVALAALNWGCTARRPQLEFTMITDLNLDGSGTRTFRVTVNQQVLDLAQSKLDDKEATVLETLDRLKPYPLEIDQNFLIPDESGSGKYVDFVLPFSSIDDLQEKLSAMTGADMKITLDPIAAEEGPSPFEAKLRLQETNHMVLYFGWVTDALQMYFRELNYDDVVLADLPVFYEIRVPGKLQRSQVGKVQVVFHKQESSWWNRAYQSMLDTFSRQTSRLVGTDGVSYSTRGVDLYEVSIIPSDFGTGVLYTEFFSRVAVERVVIRTVVVPARWWAQLLGTHPAGYQREMIVEFPENYRAYIEQNRESFSSFFARYLTDGIDGQWIESGNRLAYRLEFYARDEVSMRELSYRIVDQNKLRVREVRNSYLRSFTAVLSVLNPSNWGYTARTILTDIFTRRIEYEEALKPVSWLTSATIIKDVVYEMHFPYHLEGVGGNLSTAVVAQGQRSFTYSWPASDREAIRHVVFHARAWDAPAVLGGMTGIALFPLLLFFGLRKVWHFFRNTVFIGALQTAATATGKATRAIVSLPARVYRCVRERVPGRQNTAGLGNTANETANSDNEEGVGNTER
jgi:hypothetical protein